MIRLELKHRVSIIFTLIAVFAGERANAKVVMKPGFMYLSNSSADGTTDTRQSRMLIDLMGAYSGEKGWTVGFNYGTEQGSLATTTTTVWNVSSTTSVSSRTSTGLSGGWISTKDTGGPYVLATYFFSSSYVSTPYEYKGKGYQVDLGYRFEIQRAFFALQFSYKAFDYTTYTYGGASVTLDNPLKHTFVDPNFTMFFEF